MPSSAAAGYGGYGDGGGRGGVTERLGDSTEIMHGIARRAALRCGAEMDPSLPGQVERVLAAAGRPGAADPLDGRDLASFLVVAAAALCRIHRDHSRRTDRPAHRYLERRLQSEMGIDEGAAPDREAIIEALVTEIVSPSIG